MSAKSQKQEAKQLLNTLAQSGLLPNSLRSPLHAIIKGTEVEGTAAGVLIYGRYVKQQAVAK